MKNIFLVLLCLYPSWGLSDIGFQVPDGFRIQEYAGDDLAHNIYAMTFDSQGRCVVAGPGYVKILIDEDKDGRADKAQLFSGIPKGGAQGLCFDGRTLYCFGDGAIMRIRDDDGNDRADGPPEILRRLRSGEHGGHAIVHGPDGWFYGVAGNTAGVDGRFCMKGSPVKTPENGTIYRFSPDAKTWHVMAHGFRNSYDIAFDKFGQLFTYDSDGERYHHTPHYGPSRIYDVGIGMHHGWQYNQNARSWNKSGYFFDSVQRLAVIGRGSPTGVVVYRHSHFPPHYRDGLYSICWSFGKIYYNPLRPDGSSYATETEVFLEAGGQVGFAPVDLEVAPDGELYVAIGGRGTRGGVFRIGYDATSSASLPDDPLQRILAAPQPLSSWSRAKWKPQAEMLGSEVFMRAALDRSLPGDKRLRAVEILVEVFNQSVNGYPVANGAEDTLLARMWWGAQRVGADLVLEQPPNEVEWERMPRLLRSMYECEMENDQSKTSLPDMDPGSDWRLQQLSELLGYEQEDRPKGLAYLAGQANRPGNDLELLRILRECQVDLGDIWVEPMPIVNIGYASAESGERISSAGVATLLNWFTPDDRPVNLEISRTLAIGKAMHPDLLPKLAKVFRPASSPVSDLHYMLVFAQLPGGRNADTRERLAGAFLNLHAKMEQRGWTITRYWPFRVEAAFSENLKKDPGLAEAILENASFGHAGHTLFVPHLPKDLRAPAIRLLLAEPDTMSRELVNLINILPENEWPAFLREHQADAELRNPIILRLAGLKDPVDRELMLAGLRAVDKNVVKASALALLKQTLKPGEEVIGDAVRAWSSNLAKAEVDRLLTHWTGINTDDWQQWFVEKFPDARGLLVDVAWEKRLQTIDWSKGRVDFGKIVYASRTCASCHDGGGRLGPGLKGVGRRLTRSDMFAAMIDPNQVISPGYKALEIETKTGEVHIGSPRYESPALTILEVAPNTTVRIKEEDVRWRGPTRKSIMPEGLLTGATDQELADLYAYLKTL